MAPKAISVLLCVTLICTFIYFLTESNSVYKSEVFTRAKFLRFPRTKQSNASVTLPTIASYSLVPTHVDMTKTHESKNENSLKANSEDRSAATTATVVSSPVKSSVTRSIKAAPKASANPAVKTTHPTTLKPTTTAAVTMETDAPDVPGSCPMIPPGLVGNLTPRMELLEWPVIEEKHPELSAGGRWQPKNCHARHKVAIIVPYRKRFEHLHIFMNNMHDFLQKQQLDYGIYVIEQAGIAPFNRAKLLNVGYTEAMKDYKWHCIVLHDIDHIPLNDRNLYSCPRLPRHLSVAVQKFRFKMPYRNYLGGVTIMKSEHYQKINGMSNVYWGWGAEDDDLYNRCNRKGLVPIQRYSPTIGSYTTVQRYHQRAATNENRMSQLNSWLSRHDTDGLSNLDYTVVRKQYRKLYTDILVNIGRMF